MVRKIICLIIMQIFVINILFAQVNESSTEISNNSFQFGVSNYTVSKYIPRSGTQVGLGSANQTLGYLSYKNLTIYFWMNYGFPDETITEFDYGIEYKHNLYSDTHLGEISIVGGAHKYIFPVAQLNNFILEGKILYNGILKTDILYTHCFRSNNVDSGSRIYIELRKPVILFDKSFQIQLIPLMSSAYHWGFYGWEKWGQLTAGIKSKFVFDNISIIAYANYQYSSDDISIGHVTEKLFPYFGIGIEYNK